MAGERYTEAEAGDILRRAADSEVHPALPAAPDGYSLVELQEAASGAGIDPVAVRTAALSTLPRPAPSLATRIIGGPARRRHTFVVPGQLHPDRHAELERALEAVFDRELEVEDGGGYLLFAEDHTQGRTRVSVERVEGGTRVTVDVDRRGWVTLATVATTAVAAGLASLFAGFFLGTLEAPLLYATVIVAAAVGGVRVVWTPTARRLERTVERAAAEVVGRIEAREG